MPSGAELETQFAAGLLDPAAPVPEAVSAWNGAVQSRFAVYRNNVTVGLVESLRKRFPVCERLVGEEFFAAMAREFVRAAPPRSPLLHLYGGALADFIASFPPAASVPYLADVARLEYAYGLAYHAADEAPLKPERIQDFPQERWGDLVFTLHPSVQLVPSRWPIVAIWATNTHDADVKLVDLDIGEDALIARPALDVEVRRMLPGGLAFLDALSRGATLADAAAAASAANDGFDLTANIIGLMGAGLAIDVRPAAEPRREDG
jgi:hypothetical protein